MSKGTFTANAEEDLECWCGDRPHVYDDWPDAWDACDAQMRVGFEESGEVAAEGG